MRRVILLLALLEGLFGCAYSNRIAQSPARGALVCVENGTSETISIAAEDDAGRLWVFIQNLKPLSRRTARWPFYSQGVGRLLAGRLSEGRSPIDATFATRLFHPYAQDYWRWTVSLSSFGDQAVAAGRCS